MEFKASLSYGTLFLKTKGGGGHSWDTKVRCDFKIKEKEAGDDTCRQASSSDGWIACIPAEGWWDN